MIPSVNRFRITAIWPIVLPSLLEGPAGASTDPLRTGLALPIAYRDLFDSCRTLTNPGPPWDDPVEHRFWREYATLSNDAVKDDVPRAKVSNHLVPLHFSGSAPQQPPWKLSAHRFVYPFGVALVVHAEYPHPEPSRREGGGGALSLGEVVEACYDLREGPAGASVSSEWERITGDSIGESIQLLGIDPGDADVGTHISVVTFIDVEDALDYPETERNRILNALTVWPVRNSWMQASVQQPLQVKLSPSQAIEKRVIHAARRGRGIWFPDGFGGGGLSEAHRRMCFVTMQTEMLTRFMVTTAARLVDLPTRWGDWAAKAAVMIGRLYGNALASWDSTSPQTQIDSSDGVDAINKVRARWNEPALHAGG